MGKLYYKQLMIALIAIICTGFSITAQTIAVSAGYEHSLFLCSSNTTLGSGKNNISGTLGDGTTVPYRLTPVEQPGLTGITAISSGAFHSLFLKNDGTVWACGNNGGGQLGDGSNTNAIVAVQVSGLNGITAIAAGYFYSLFLKNDGTVWASGDNTNGQLGDGTNTSSNTPVQVTGLSGVTAIAAGWYHSLFLKNDGTVWSCGGNSNGQLGDGTNTDANTPVQVSDLTGITAVSCGYGHSLFLKNDGSAWSCGYNQSGQLGSASNTSESTPVKVAVADVAAISAGTMHSIFLKNDGTAVACGLNQSGRLGDGTTSNTNTPVPVMGLGGIIAVAAGGYHSLFLKNDGTAWSCGFNSSGQLGNGSAIFYSTSIAVQVTGLCMPHTYYFDGDGDGYGKENSTTTSNSSIPPAGYAASAGDCNDGDASINPGATEICGDGVDNNCDGQTDEDCTYTYYFDGDGDGYGKTNSPTTTNDPIPPPDYAVLDGDCDDTKVSVNPGKPEICGDGIDNNCDGQIDEGCSVTYTYYFDGDGDGYGKTNSPTTTNDPIPPPDYAVLDGDCDDTKVSVNPGKPEICGDGIDNNCDGQIDEGCSVTYTYYFDGDGDGYGKTNSPTTTNDPIPPPDYAVLDGDCDDTKVSVNPGKPEICGDGIDNNCDGQIDEGCSVTYTYYFDGDGDGYGKTNSPTTTNDPIPPPDYAVLDGDCDDTKVSVNPGKPEICGDGIDNNCDGQIDEGCSATYTYYFDGDADGYGKTNSPTTSNSPTPPPDYAVLDGDCDDTKVSVNPGKPEICGDGIDNNCDGQIDEGCLVTNSYHLSTTSTGHGIIGTKMTFTADAGYHIADIQIDGSSMGAITSYTFSNMTADHAVNAIFAVNTFSVTATAATNGTISPAGSTIVNYGGSLTYTITPKTGYHTTQVTIDGSPVGAVGSYTFTNVIRNHTIKASFAINAYTIVSSAGDNGTITPNGFVSVNYGGSKKYTIKNNTGYHILDVLVDGVSVGAVKTYTFTSINANHTISASFASNTTVNNSAVAAKQLNEGALGLSARPNPFKNDLTVIFTVAKKGEYDLTVTDMSGRVLSKQKLDASAGSNMTNLNVARYAGGSYFITLTGDSKTKTIKVIKAQ